jgi:hypothetical protein
MLNIFMDIQLMFKVTIKSIISSVQYSLNPTQIVTEPEKLEKHLICSSAKTKKAIKLELCTALTAVTCSTSCQSAVICDL